MSEYLQRLMQEIVDEEALVAEANKPASDFTRDFRSSVYGLAGDAARFGAEITGSTDLYKYSDRQKKAAQLEAERSKSVSSYTEVDDIGSALSYAGRGIATSLPYLPLMAAGGVAGVAGRAALGLRVGSVASRVAPAFGAAAATYPSEVGAKLSEQEEVGGEANLAQAMAIAAPSAALNVAGIGRVAIAKGFGRGAARGAARGATEEGLAEVGQEFLTSVNKNISSDGAYELFGEPAIQAYKESAVAGILLGGTVGGTVGGVSGRAEARREERARIEETRRVEETEAAQTEETNTDLTAKAEEIRRRNPVTDRTLVRSAPLGEVNKGDQLKLQEARRRLLREERDPKAAKKNQARRDRIASELYRAQVDRARSGVRMPTKLQTNDFEIEAEPLDFDRSDALRADARKFLGKEYESILSENWARDVSDYIYKTLRKVDTAASDPKGILKAEPDLTPMQEQEQLADRVTRVGARLDELEQETAKLKDPVEQLKRRNILALAQRRLLQYVPVRQEQLKPLAEAEAERVENARREQLLDEAIAKEEQTEQELVGTRQAIRDAANMVEPAPEAEALGELTDETIRAFPTMKRGREAVKFLDKLINSPAAPTPKAVKGMFKAKFADSLIGEREIPKAIEAYIDTATSWRELEKLETEAAQAEAKDRNLKDQDTTLGVPEAKAPTPPKPKAKPAPKPKAQKIAERAEKRRAAKAERRAKVEADIKAAKEKREAAKQAEVAKAEARREARRVAEVERLREVARKREEAAKSAPTKRKTSTRPAKKAPTLPAVPTKKVEMTAQEKAEFRKLADALPDTSTRAKARIKQLIAEDRYEDAVAVYENRQAAKGDLPKLEVYGGLDGPSVSVEKARNFIASLTNNWRGGPEIRVLGFDDLNPAEIARMERQGFIRDGKVVTAGLYSPTNNTVTIFPETMDSMEDVKAVLFHEALGHFGLRAAYGRDMFRLMQDLYDTNDSVRLRAEQQRTLIRELNAETVPAAQRNLARKRPFGKINDRRTYNDETRYVIEEALATMLEAEVRPTLFQEVIAKLRGWARRMGLKNLKWSNSEVAALLRDVQRSAVSGKPDQLQNLLDVRIAMDNIRTSESIADTTMPLPPLPAVAEAAPKFAAFIDNKIETIQDGQIKEFMRSASTNVKYFTKGTRLGSLFLRPLLDYIKKKNYLKGVEDYERFTYAQDAEVRKLNERIDRTANKVQRLPDGGKGMMAALREATIDEEWGFDPNREWKDWPAGAQFEPTSKAAKQFNKLTPEEKSVYKELIRHQYDTRRQIQSLIVDEINAAEAEAARSTTDPVKLRRIRERKKADLIQSDAVFKNMRGPYMPLSRFGNYAVIGRSAEMTAVDKRLKALEAKQDLTEADVTELSEVRKKREEMRRDADHYFVSFEETPGSADARVRQMSANNKNMKFDWSERVDIYKDKTDAPWQTIQKLRARVADRLGGAEADDTKSLAKEYETRFTRMLDDLYIASLAEASARRHDLKREGIAGASEDMMRSWVTKSTSDARFIGAVKYSGPITRSLSEMRRSTEANAPEELGVKGTRAERMQAFKELMVRHNMTLDVEDNWWTRLQDKAMLTSSVWLLLSSPKYFLMNATQTPLITLPVLAGKYGYAAASKEIAAAYKVWGSEVNKDLTNAFIRGSFDTDAVQGITEAERTMLKTVQDAGLMDIGLNTELGQFQKGQDRNAFSQGIVDMVGAMQSVARQVEVANRVTAALAAYRLATRKGSSPEAATLYAKEVINDTHGDYNDVNAPRLFKQLPKVVTQFRKYQMIQIALWGKMIKQAVKPETREERATAIAMMGFMAGQTALTTGLLTLPAVSTAIYVGNALFGDPDEPLDIEREVRKFIGNEYLSNVILQGGLGAIGVDATASMGFGQMLSIAPFADGGIPKTSDEVASLAWALAGPAAGVASTIATGYGYMMEGDMQKGIEMSLPLGLKSMMRAYREHTEGITKRNGDVLVRPEDIPANDIFWSILGFRSTSKSAISAAREHAFVYGQYVTRRTSALKKQYMEARKSGDRAGIREAIQSFNKLQKWAVDNGIKERRTPLSTFIRSEITQKKREQRARDQLERIRP
jgi:hypothetical protein